MKRKFNKEKQIRLAMILTQVVVPLLAIMFVIIYIFVGVTLAY